MHEGVLGTNAAEVLWQARASMTLEESFAAALRDTVEAESATREYRR